MGSLFIDKDKLKQMLEEGHTFSAIAKALGCTKQNVYLHARRMGYRPRYHPQRSIVGRFIDKTGRTAAQLADEMGYSAQHMQRLANGHEPVKESFFARFILVFEDDYPEWIPKIKEAMLAYYSQRDAAK